MEVYAEGAAKVQSSVYIYSVGFCCVRLEERPCQTTTLRFGQDWQPLNEREDIQVRSVFSRPSHGAGKAVAGNNKERELWHLLEAAACERLHKVCARSDCPLVTHTQDIKSCFGA